MTRINGSGDINKVSADGGKNAPEKSSNDTKSPGKIVATAAGEKSPVHSLSSTANQSAVNRFGADKLRALANGMKNENVSATTLESLSGLEHNEEFLQILAETDPQQAEAILSQQWDAVEAESPEGNQNGLYAALGLAE